MKMHEQVEVKYSTFIQMNSLWLQYISVLLTSRPAEIEKGFDIKDLGVQTSLCSKLTKADFTGARVKIVNALNTEMIGTEGIVIRETTRTFVIV